MWESVSNRHPNPNPTKAQNLTPNPSFYAFFPHTISAEGLYLSEQFSSTLTLTVAVAVAVTLTLTLTLTMTLNIRGGSTGGETKCIDGEQSCVTCNTGWTLQSDQGYHSMTL
jgi:hypothetical protein